MSGRTKSDQYALVRGMRDLMPGEVERHALVEQVLTKIVRSYGYAEIRQPLLEYTALFSRGLGEATDAVEKEMYTLDDRDGDSLALRPEGTASCARAVIKTNMLREGKPKLWYAGSMFRYERPQKGRYRQFYQIGAEAFGIPGPDVDAELITMAADMWQALGIDREVTLEINTIGSGVSRQAYRDALVEYLTPRVAELDPDSVKRLESNPMRILDSKNARTQAVLEGAPDLHEYVDDVARAHFDGLRERLDAIQLPYRVNRRLVRGFDYYTHTVVEWVTDKLGSQGTICAGGRYDGLVARLGGPDTPAAGFALGLDRVALLHEAVEGVVDTSAADVYAVVMEPAFEPYVARVAAVLRRETGLRVRSHHGGGKIKSQMRQADRSGARWAVIVGEDEVAQNRVTLKWLREDEPQSTMAVETLVQRLAERPAERLANDSQKEV